MRIILLMAALLVLDGCNDTTHSSVEGVYRGNFTWISYNFMPPRTRALPTAGAVGPDGHGYFIYPGAPNGVLQFENLMHAGSDSIYFDDYPPATNPLALDVKPAPSGYKFSFSYGEVDVAQEFNYATDPVTDQPKSLAELAGNYQGNDVVQNSYATAALDDQGHFKGIEGFGCSFQGQLSQVDGKNLYTVTFQTSGGGGCDLTANGAAWVDDTDLPGTTPDKGTYLNIIASTPVDAQYGYYGFGLSLKLQ